MKRFASYILIATILLTAFSASATSLGSSISPYIPEHTGPTTACKLVEFVELSTQRITEYQLTNNVDFSISSIGDMDPVKIGDYLYFTSSLAAIYVYPDTCRIHDLSLTLSSSKDDKTVYEKRYVTAAMVMSALEYNAMQDSLMKLTSTSAADASLLLVKYVLGPNLKSAAQEALATGEKVKIYSGNYDYFIECIEWSGEKIVYLVAEVHD